MKWNILSLLFLWGFGSFAMATAGVKIQKVLLPVSSFNFLRNSQPFLRQIRGGKSSTSTPRTSLSNETLASLIQSLSRVSHLDHQIPLSSPQLTTAPPLLNHQQLLSRIFDHWNGMSSEQTLKQNKNQTTLLIKSVNTLLAKFSMTFQISTLIQQNKNQSFVFLETLPGKKSKTGPYQILVQITHQASPSHSESLKIIYSVVPLTRVLPVFSSFDSVLLPHSMICSSNLSLKSFKNNSKRIYFVRLVFSNLDLFLPLLCPQVINLLRIPPSLEHPFLALSLLVSSTGES
jgi:hypothetical protein